MKNVFLLLILINSCFPLVPIWNLEENTVPFFSSDSPNYKEIVAFQYDIYQLVNIYKKNNDGTVSVSHKLSINSNVMWVEFGSMEVFYYIAKYGQIICPKGKYHPLDANGNEIKLPITNSNLDWQLKCVGHHSGVFLAFYLNKDHQALFGYLEYKDGGKWDGGNTFQNGVYNLKIKNDCLGNNFYPIIFLAQDGDYIKLIGAKQTLNKGLAVDRTNVETKTLIRRKEHTFAFFSDTDDKFYLITYDKNSYSIVYSLNPSIGDYTVNYNIQHAGEIMKENLILPFSGKIEILSMNFIEKTQYVYYSVNNLETGAINYGIMDLLSQQILFNTDHQITNFEPLSNNEMLVITSTGANKICLFRNGDNCVSSCPSGTKLVLDVKGNKCDNSDECDLKLVPDNICIESCDTNIYKLSDDKKSCGLCGYFNQSKPYRLIKTEECFESPPEGTQIYLEKYSLLECAKGYQFDSDKKMCVPHCYPSCVKCNDYSEDSTNQNCISCKEGYYLNETNCKLIETDAPSTILEIPPTTILNIPPTTIINIPPTTIINNPPTTIIKIPPTTILNIPPTTIINIPLTTIINSPPTTIINIPTTTIINSPPTTFSINTLTSTTIIKDLPTTSIKNIPSTIPTIENKIESTEIFFPTPVPKNLIESTTTISSTSITSSIAPTFWPKIISSTSLIIPQSIIELDKCINGSTLNENCKNITDEKINLKIKEEILSLYAENSQMKEFKTQNYKAQVGNTSSEMTFLNPENDMPVIDLGYCETLLKEANGIPLDQSLIMIKIENTQEDNINDQKNKILDVDVFDPITLKKLNLSVCDNTTIDVYTPLIMSETNEEIYKNLIDEGYDPFDLSDKFYREICTPYTSENGTDVLLDEREEFVYSTIINESRCMGNCEYVSYSLDTKYMKCECPVNNTYTTLDIKHISGENIYMSFMSVFKSTNYKVMICYNLVFNLKIFVHNFGSILSLICFGVYIIFMIIYCIREISPLKVHISKLIFKDTEKIENLNSKYIKEIKKENIKIYKEVSNTKLIKNIKIKNPPKKLEKRKTRIETSEDIKNTENNEFINSSNDNRKNKRKSIKRKSKFEKDINKKENNMEETQENKQRAKYLDMYELNNLEYDEACEFDNRGFCKTYWSVLLREHLVLFTFFTCYDYNLFYIKIERFFVLICTQMTINGLFFIHESMHRKYTQGEDLNFIEKIPQLLFTLIGAHIIEVILCYFSMTDVHVYEIKSLPKEEKNSEKLLKIMDRMKRKLVWFFFITFLLFLFYWYFISAFCAVYQNTQIIFLRDSGISILTSFLDPFVIYGVTTILRLISLSLCCKKKLGCIYKLSDIIPIF